MLASRDRLEAEFRERGKALPKLPADELIEILKDLYAELFANTLKLALAAKIGATEEDMVHIVDTIRATGLTLADVCSMAPFPIPDRSAGKDPAAAAAPEGGAA